MNEIMSEEAINELIDGFEIVGSLTEYGRKNIKYHFQRLKQENQQLKEELQKSDSITQSCIFQGKEESTINFRKRLKQLDLYKSVMDEVKEYIKLISSDYDTLYNQDIELVIKHLLEILNKVKENK